MTALDEIRATRLLTDLAGKIPALEREVAALPEAVGKSVAEALEDSAQRHQAHARTLHQEQTAWREVQERHVAALSIATDTLQRLIALNETLMHRRGLLYRRGFILIAGVLLGAALMFGAFVSGWLPAPDPSWRLRPPTDTRALALALSAPARVSWLPGDVR